jgi:predicted nucleic acid-binding protein
LGEDSASRKLGKRAGRQGDERLGRAHAEALKLTFTGTLGILLRAKVEGRIPRIEPVLDHLDRLGFRLSTRTRSAALKILDS